MDRLIEDGLLEAIESREFTGDSSRPELTAAMAVMERIEGLFALLRTPVVHMHSASDEGVEVGSRIDDFEIVRPLGTGTFGHVYLAHQLSLGRFVALKIAKLRTSEDARLRSRWASEGVILGSVCHPNVVPVVSAGECKGRQYLVMEYLPGPAFLDILNAVRAAPATSNASEIIHRRLAGDKLGDAGWESRGAALDRTYWMDIVVIFRSVARGLGALHAAGVVHRDLKPANVVFDRDGSPKIVDLGLARSRAGIQLTLAGEFLGSPAYASPEQAKGEGADLGPHSDVFSLGVMLYEALSLKQPFDGSDAIGVLRAVSDADYLPLRRVCPHLPWELEAIVDKCLHKSPAARYKDASVLVADLDAFIECRSISAHRVTFARRAVRYCQRRPWTALSACLFISLLCITAILAHGARVEFVAAQEHRRQAAIQAFIDKGDVALFAYFNGPHPAWLPKVQQGRRDEAVRAYSEAITLASDNVWPVLQRARLRLFTSGRQPTNNAADIHAAREDLLLARRLQPDYVSVQMYLAVVYRRLGDVDLAQELDRKAVTLPPRDSSDLYFLANFAGSVREDHGEAYRLYTECLAKSPNHYWARLERVMYGQPAAVDLETFNQIRREELQTANQLRPDLPYAREWMSEFAMADSRVDDRELSDLEALASDFGTTILRAHALADAYLAHGRAKDATKVLRLVVDDDTGGLTARKLGEIAERDGDLDEAENWYRQAITHSATGESTWQRLADVQSRQGDLTDAEATLKDAISTFPDRIAARHALAWWCLRHDRSAQVEQIHRDVLSLPESYEHLGARIEQGTQKETSVQFLNGVLASRGEHTKRIELLEQSIDRGWAKSSATWRLLFHAYLATNQNAEADQLVTRAIGQFVANPGSFQHASIAADLLATSGRGEAATTHAALVGQAATFVADRSTRESLGILALAAVADVSLWSRRNLIKWRLGESLSANEYASLIEGFFDSGPPSRSPRGDEKANRLKFTGEAIQKHPDHHELWALRALALLDASDRDAATQAYHRAYELLTKSLQSTDQLRISAEIQDRTTHGSTMQRLFEFLLREGKEEECERLELEMRSLLAGTSSDFRVVERARALAEYGMMRWSAALKSLDRAIKSRALEIDATLPKVFTCYTRLHDSVGMVATMHAYARLPNCNPAVLQTMLSRTVFEGNDFARSKSLLVIEELPDSLMNSSISLLATASAFRAWWLVTHGNAEQRELAKTEAERAQVASELAMSVVRNDEWLATVGTQLEIVWKVHGDKRSEKWQKILSKLPAATVDRANLAFRQP